jgi:hypothetical protein
VRQSPQVEYAEPIALSPDYDSSTASTNLDDENYVTIGARRSSPLVPASETIARSPDHRSSTNLDEERYATIGATRGDSAVPAAVGGGDGDYSVFLAEGTLRRTPPT